MNFQSYINKIRSFISYKVFTSLIYLILAALVLFILYHNVKPETYEVNSLSIAEKTIRSPRTVVDELKTAEAKELAAEEVGKAYVYKKEMGQNRVSLIASIFDFVEETNREITKSSQEIDPSDVNKIESVLAIENRLKVLKSKLNENISEDVTKSISNETLITLLNADQTNLQKMREVVITQVETTMAEKIREEDIDNAKNRLEDSITEIVLSSAVEKAAAELGKYAVVANDLYDPELTEERRKQAMEEVEPIRILQGQIIVQEGHFIDKEIYRQLEMLGLLKSNPSSKPLFGVALFVLLTIGTIYFTFVRLGFSNEKKQNYLLLTSLIFMISLVIMQIIKMMEDTNINGIAFIIPAAVAPMLIKILINERFALIMTIILSACGSIVFSDGISGAIDIEIALYILFSGLASILFIPRRNERSHILKAGLFVAIINILVILFLILVGGGQFSTAEYIYYFIYAIVSGLLSSVLTIGLLPFLEAGFGILSTMRLIELSNPNHPLLKKLLTETPGTYHHSVMVANLAESACEAIGANGLLARVGCYYHDVGKTKRPPFFIENQVNIENPHDRLPPETSKDIIIAHATDGARELRKHKLPKEIVDIAEQHHGTSLLKYFYYKAKEKNPDVLEKDFRYPGPKPQTREAAIISLADSVEAAVRSMANPTQEEIRSLVNKIVQDKLQDNQFNECDLTLKELKIVTEGFCETLNGIFHSRIEYPDFKQQKVITDGAST